MSVCLIPLTQQFHIVILGVLQHYFLIFVLNRRLWVLGFTVYPQSLIKSKNKKNVTFFQQKIINLNHSILDRHAIII